MPTSPTLVTVSFPNAGAIGDFIESKESTAIDIRRILAGLLAQGLTLVAEPKDGTAKYSIVFRDGSSGDIALGPQLL